MRLSNISIQKKLIAALVVLSLLVILSSFVALVAFEKINSSQELLLEESLPAMRFVDGAVDDGFDLIDIGAKLPGVETMAELVSLKAISNTIFDKIKQDNDYLAASEIRLPDINVIKIDTNKVIDNIRKQFFLKEVILNDTAVLDSDSREIVSVIEKLLIDIKVISAAISLNLLDGGNSTNRQAYYEKSVFIDLGFKFQQIKSIVEDVKYIDSTDQVQKNENDTRALIHKIANSIVNVDPEYRDRLGFSAAVVSDKLLIKNGFFSIATHRIIKEEELNNIQAENITISQELSLAYRHISEEANRVLDYKAKDVLKITSRLEWVLVFAVFLSLFFVFCFYLFFIKPRLINRLLSLTENTRAIASNSYDVDIDIEGSDEITAMAESLAYFRDELVDKDSIQKQLSDREKALSSIINHTVEGMFSVDLEGFIITFNPACEIFFQASADAVIGRHVSCLLPNEIEAFNAHEKREVILEGDGFVVIKEKQVAAYNFYQEQFVGRLSVSLLNLSGKQTYSCFLMDVTKEHEAREKIDLLVEKLSQSNSDLERFAYSCSHDLQEPVRMIQSFSELLENRIGKDLDEKSLQYMHFILQSAKHAKQLIKDMLEYSKLDQSNVAKSWVSLGELCIQVNEMTTLVMEENQGELVWRNDDQQLYVVMPQMLQLLVNLVTNGFKYNQSQSKVVSIECAEEEAYWLLCVKDNGIGIDSRYKEKIFEVFSRLVNRRDFEGSGIGLSICKKIVDKHGGTIWVESELGKGSQFYIRLPKVVE